MHTRSPQGHNRTTISIEEFFSRFIQHIPEKFFKMTRYYGLFATAVRGKTLPKLFKIFNQKLKDVTLTTFQQLSIFSLVLSQTDNLVIL